MKVYEQIKRNYLDGFMQSSGLSDAEARQSWERSAIRAELHGVIDGAISRYMTAKDAASASRTRQ